jgi:DeoR family transcriptional regulator, fructose operon transcriptional repressor
VIRRRARWSGFPQLRPDDPDSAVSNVKARVMEVSRRRVFGGVHTKFGAVSFCWFAEVSGVEANVTDTGLPLAEGHRYSLLGPQVIRV